MEVAWNSDCCSNLDQRAPECEPTLPVINASTQSRTCPLLHLRCSKLNIRPSTLEPAVKFATFQRVQGVLVAYRSSQLGHDVLEA